MDITLLFNYTSGGPCVAQARLVEMVAAVVVEAPVMVTQVRGLCILSSNVYAVQELFSKWWKKNKSVRNSDNKCTTAVHLMA